MAFKNDVKTAVAGGADVVLFTCPAGAEASIHTLFLDAQSGAATATLKLTLQATGQTVTFLDAFPLANNEPFTFPKPINMTAGDTVSLSAATNDVVALISAFQDDNGGSSASFNIRGEYDNTFTYNKLDVVTLNGTSFVAVNDGVSGSTPPSANWMVLAAKGETGQSAFTAGDGLTLTGSEFAIDSTVVTNAYTGNVDIDGELLATSYIENFETVTSTSNSVTVDVTSGNSFGHTLTENTTFTFANPPASGTANSFSLEIIQDGAGSGFTVGWPASVVWSSATAPTLTATADGKDIFVFYTRDGGVTYYGFVAGQAFG
jgi:hypothetical protein